MEYCSDVWSLFAWEFCEVFVFLKVIKENKGVILKSERKKVRAQVWKKWHRVDEVSAFLEHIAYNAILHVREAVFQQRNGGLTVEKNLIIGAGVKFFD